MNKKGFALFGLLISLLVLFFIVQYAIKAYRKSLSSVSAVKTGSIKRSTGKQVFSLQEGVLLKSNILPQLDNLIRQQEFLLATTGSYGKDMSAINTPPTNTAQYRYGVRADASGWVAWVKKTGGNNKFQLFKNAKTKQLCCKDIDSNVCQYLDVGAKKCPFK